ncbi:PASTA domain-containing protein [Solirubrobacter soli]|uniref:PASTA domain-containing protein n=1 Tax=Solirubrobacter soli TaxID=363832 RepID=UPI00040BAB54|nr:PASTA domain-containing protein [Solirubrobacter soli]
MRTCQSCGKENPPDRDFCSCGEYLRWEPTGFVQAITPEMAAEAQAQAAPPKAPEPAAPTPPPVAHVTPAAPPAPTEGGNGNGHHAAPPVPPTPTPAERPAPPPPTAASLPAIVPPVQPPAPTQPPSNKTLVRNPAVQPPQQVPVGEANESASIVLRLPEGEPAKGELLHQAVEPGQRERVLALIRNQSGIVDNYDIRVEGMPQDWWSVYPGTVYLVPFGSGGTYEQEVEIHLHPPRGPEAEARVWDLKIVADSKAMRTVAAVAPLALHIQPYIETMTTLRPQRKKGRRRATFDVTVSNKANAPVLIALEGEDPDGELQFGFNRPPSEIPAGAAIVSQMQVRPPKQIWIGRAREHRLEVKTITGDEAAERAADQVVGADVLLQAGPQPKKKWYKRSAPRVPGMYPPRVYKPQLYPPDVNMGPGGLQVRMPQLKAPQVQGPQMGSVNAQQFMKPGQLKLPGRGGGAPTGPLMPTQGVFKQKPWLPWWLIPLLLLLLLLLFFLLRTLPQNVVVPNVVNQKSTFDAEKKLTEADLKLDPNKKEQPTDKAKAGTILQQTPKAGEKVEKGTPVAVLVAVGTGKHSVPDITKKTASDADALLRTKDLTLGQASPQPVDPKGLIVSQIPAAGEIVKAGTPVNIFYADPADAANKKKQKDKGKNGAGGAGGAGGGGGGGGDKAAADIIIPAIGKDDLDTYAKKVADLGIVPKVRKEFNDAPKGTLFATDPPGGTKVAPKSTVTLLVSVGQPQVVYTNGKDILRLNGANGQKLDPVATSPDDETNPTWTADGEHVAYISGGRVMLKDLTKKNSAAVPLTPDGREFADLAWAPTGDRNMLAMDEIKRDDQDNVTDTNLCLALITKETEINCIDEPGFSVIRHLHWGTDGRSILGVGVKNNTGLDTFFGIVRWKVKADKPAFSVDPADWTKGKFLTDTDTSGKGVLDAEVSPDGKRLALVSNLGSSFYRLWLADDKEDFALSSAKPTAVRACKVTWRGDSKELLVVTADAECREDVASVERIPANDVRDKKELTPTGDDPSYQPLTIGG